MFNENFFRRFRIRMPIKGFRWSLFSLRTHRMIRKNLFLPRYLSAFVHFLRSGGASFLLPRGLAEISHRDVEDKITLHFPFFCRGSDTPGYLRTFLESNPDRPTRSLSFWSWKPSSLPSGGTGFPETDAAITAMLHN